jgi:hypothetical protein
MAAVRWLAKEQPADAAELLPSALNWLRNGYDEGFPPADAESFLAYFAHPNETRPLVESAGFDVIGGPYGVEGCVSMIEADVNEQTGAAWEAWVAINLEVAGEPTLLSGNEHLLVLGRRQ